MFKIQFLDTFLYWIELNNGIGLIICGLRMPKFTMIQSVMSLFCEFGLLTENCTHCFVEGCLYCCGFSGVRWAANSQACVDLFV